MKAIAALAAAFCLFAAPAHAQSTQTTTSSLCVLSGATGSSLLLGVVTLPQACRPVRR